MTRIEKCVQSVRRRQQRQWLWQCVSTSSAFFAVVACVIALLRIPFPNEIAWYWVAIALAAGPVLGCLHAAVNVCTEGDAASEIDRVNGLKDRTQTALSFLSQNGNCPLQKLQVADAEKALMAMDPTKVVPVSTPRSFPVALGLATASLLIVGLTIRAPKVEAALVSDPSILEIADKVNEDLKALEEFQKEHQDPEVEKVLKELAEQIEALKTPGVQPKDAMAKLSEMETMLMDLQKQQDSPSEVAQLKDVGEALSLSQEMAKAAAALQVGKLDEAAEELEKLESPELDQKTEKAIREKLEAIANSQDGQNSKNQSKVQKATEQVNEGLAGNRSKFKDGMQGLASEAKSQSKKKKLMDILRSQCKGLGECKSNCQSTEKTNNTKKTSSPTNSYGLAASNNEAGDKTAALKTGKEMQLKGVDSGVGESEIETEAAPEQEQQAARAYREKAEQFEALNESVLNSENIPLGQRQTIRKYFESIRPTNSELDTLNQTEGTK